MSLNSYNSRHSSMDNKKKRDFTPLYLLITSFTTMLYLLLLLPTSPVAAIHGPHHPKSSVREIHSTHYHYAPEKSENGEVHKITQDRNLLQDKEHIKEDMGEWMFEDGREPTAEEMEFHYFSMHDFDNNSQLDGLEILQALTHVLPISDEQEPNTHSHSHSHSSSRNSKKEKSGFAINYEDKNNRPVISEENLNYYIDLIDEVLEEDDVDKDGYLSYAEYVIGRRREDSYVKPMH